MKRDGRPAILEKGWAPGWYHNTCLLCREDFLGDKRATCCADCAYTVLPELYTAEEIQRPPKKDYRWGWMHWWMGGTKRQPRTHHPAIAVTSTDPRGQRKVVVIVFDHPAGEVCTTIMPEVAVGIDCIRLVHSLISNFEALKGDEHAEAYHAAAEQARAAQRAERADPAEADADED
jgi:hypothetical protein